MAEQIVIDPFENWDWGWSWSQHKANAGTYGEDRHPKAGTKNATRLDYVSPVAGTVAYVGGTYNAVVVELDEPIGDAVYFVLLENFAVKVKKGQRVEPFTVLANGMLDRDGAVRWPHYHLAKRGKSATESFTGSVARVNELRVRFTTRVTMTKAQGRQALATEKLLATRLRQVRGEDIAYTRVDTDPKAKEHPAGPLAKGAKFTPIGYAIGAPATAYKQTSDLWYVVAPGRYVAAVTCTAVSKAGLEDLTPPELPVPPQQPVEPPVAPEEPAEAPEEPETPAEGPQEPQEPAEGPEEPVEVPVDPETPAQDAEGHPTPSGLPAGVWTALAGLAAAIAAVVGAILASINGH